MHYIYFYHIKCATNPHQNWYEEYWTLLLQKICKNEGTKINVHFLGHPIFWVGFFGLGMSTQHIPILQILSFSRISLNFQLYINSTTLYLCKNRKITFYVKLKLKISRYMKSLNSLLSFSLMKYLTLSRNS